MTKFRFDYSNAQPFFSEHELDYMRDFVKVAHHSLHEKTGAGNDFLGWIDLPVHYDKEEFARIEKAAAKIRQDSDVLVVIGIGGSYLGARAAIEMLQHSFYNVLAKEKRNGPQIIFAGNNISSTYMSDVIDLLKEKIFPSMSFPSRERRRSRPSPSGFSAKYWRKNTARKKRQTDLCHDGQRKRRFKTLANEEGYESFVIPDDIGGRYSVLTAVGLLPIAVSGADIRAMMKGAADARNDFAKSELDVNYAYQYAAVETFCTTKEKRLRCSSTMNRRCNILPSGGSSCSARAKERT